MWKRSATVCWKGYVCGSSGESLRFEEQFRRILCIDFLNFESVNSFVAKRIVSLRFLALNWHLDVQRAIVLAFCDEGFAVLGHGHQEKWSCLRNTSRFEVFNMVIDAEVVCLYWFGILVRSFNGVLGNWSRLKPPMVDCLADNRCLFCVDRCWMHCLKSGSLSMFRLFPVLRRCWEW